MQIAGERIDLNDVEIGGLTSDSRSVAPGMLFAALPGTKADGRRFIADAVKRGATCILAAPGTDSLGVALIEDQNPRRRLSLLAANFYGAQPETVALITGTNGKTSTASFARQIWARLGHKAASLGTLGVHAPNRILPGSLTTPDPITLHAEMAQLALEGVSHLAMEASSHGIDQFRLDGVQAKLAAFTNLTRDHLDYHGSMEAYRAAKLRLFSELLDANGIAVANADAPEFALFRDAARARGITVLSFGTSPSDFRLLAATPTAQGQDLELEILGRRSHLALPLAGGFQTMNALCALALAVASGEDASRATETLAFLEGVPGRLEQAALRKNDASVYVDYAHTPDALEKAILALRPHAEGRLLVVFGCGGDRDPGKRPQMGAIAARQADKVFITDDNPRSEDPALIRKAIMAACPKGIEIADRAQAIRAAVSQLQAGDLLLIAGKGHETGQKIGDVVLPFDDRTEARKAVAEADA